MDGLTEKNEATIRAFLRYCLDDGFYAFVVDGKKFLLESEDDIDAITAAIRKAKPPVIRYRIAQAEQALDQLGLSGQHHDLQPA